MSKPRKRTAALRAYVTIAGLLTSIFLTLAIRDAHMTARAAASANVDRTIDRAFAELDVFIVAASADLASYVSQGFARLSTDSIVGRPNFGIVKARLRVAESVYPLRVPFVHVAIVDERGRVLWTAAEPGEGQALRFGHVVAGNGAQIDSVSVATAILDDSMTHTARIGDGVRLLQAFHTDPYDRIFVVTADLAAATLLERVAAYCVDTEHVRFEIESSATAPGESADAGMAPAARRAWMVDASLAWPDMRWQETRTHALSGMLVCAHVDLGTRFQTILWRHKFAFLAAASAFGCGFLFVRHLAVSDSLTDAAA